jgi:hypothetical protein
MKTEKLKAVRAALISANRDLLEGEFTGEIETLTELIDNAEQPSNPLNEKYIKQVFQKFGTGRLDGFTAAIREVEEKIAIKEASAQQKPEPACWQGEDKCPNRQACFHAENCLFAAVPTGSGFTSAYSNITMTGTGDTGPTPGTIIG